MLYERRHTKDINAFGGVWKLLPVFSGLALVITLSSMGLPGLNGFVGEFTILLGSFGSSVLGFWFTLFATIGVILAAVYLLYMWNKVFMGEPKTALAAGDGHDGHGAAEAHDAHGAHDDHGHGAAAAANPYTPLTWNESLALVLVVIAALVIGLYPKPNFDAMDASVGATAAELQRYIPGDTATVQAEP
jgi:NADH:ubiquinone oxidoreductase subunit 4 (subunit M)